MAKFIPENIQTLLSTFTFDIDNDCINEDITCTICKKLLHDAYQSTCECKYCRKCIVSYINNGNKYCPGGKKECCEELLVLEESVSKNVALNKKVLKVNVRCPNESCQFASTLKQMDNHMMVCSLQAMKCPYTKIGCANVKVNRDSVEFHLNKDMFAHSQMLMEVVDNLKNEVGGLKEELRANKLEMASLWEEIKLNERKIREVEKEMSQEKKRAEGLKGEVAALRGQLKCAEESLTNLTEEVKELKGEIQIEGNMSRNMRGEIEVQQGDVKRIDDVIGRKETAKKAMGIFDVEVGELTKTVDSLSKLVNKDDAVGSLWFKVDRFDELRNKGGIIFSPHLYSHINGYKLRILVNVSFCRGLDVFSVVCKGEYDDELSWPASGLSVSVSVIDYHTKEEYTTWKIKYYDQNGSKPIHKDNEPYGGTCLAYHSAGLIFSNCLLLLLTARPP